jgi:hypothetical protein
MEEGQRKKVFKKDADLDLTMATLFGVIYQTTHAVFRKRWARSGESEEVYRERVKKFLYDLLGSYLIK